MTLVEQYKRDGYVVLPDVLEWRGIPTFDWLRHVADQDFLNFRAAARMVACMTGTHSMFHAPAIRKFMDEIIQVPAMTTQPVCHAMGFDELFEGTKPHQDYPAIQTSLNAVTVWIPFQDVGLDNFPVEVVPGSHLCGLLPARSQEHYSEVDAAGMEFVPVPVQRGSVLLFSVFTVHRTRFPGIGTRVACSHRYEDAADMTFAMRDYRSAQKRVIERDLLWTPTVEQVRSVFA